MGWETAKEPLFYSNAIHVGMNQGFPKETIMKSDLMELLLLLSVGMGQGQAPPLEQPSHVATLQAREAVPAHKPQTSSARKAEAVRRLFWVALSLR